MKMVLKVFSVYDSKVEAYLQPFYMRSKGEALRAFGEVVNSQDHLFSRHPADYTLFEIGEFDEGKGDFTMHTHKTPLGTALEHKSKPTTQLPLTAINS
jgi:hypothetical protein